MTDVDKKDGFFENMKKTYRLSIMNNDTFKEVGCFKFNYYGIIFSVLGVMSLLTLLVFFFISYTPLRYYVPGYGSMHSDKMYIEMKNRLDELEKYVADVKVYTNNMKNLLQGNYQSIDDIDKEVVEITDITRKVNRIPEDDSLRSKIDINKDLIEIAQSSGVPALSINNVEQMYLIAPVKGYISAQYNESSEHYGVDIIASEKETVKAVTDGVVIIAESSIEYGMTIGIQHPNDLVTYYKHNSTLLKSIGDVVKEGDAIAIIGNTGRLTSGPHLHFEMWYKGKSLNPARYIETIK